MNARMPRRLLAVVTLTLALALPCPAVAETYRVELVVFASDSGEAGEALRPGWRIRAGLPVQAQAPADVAAPDAPVFAELEQLVEAAERLERHPQYRVLETLAWEQTLASKASALRVELPGPAHGGDAPVAGAQAFAVNGFARLYRAAQPQFELSLRYRPDPPPLSETLYVPTPYTREFIDREYVIDERRRITLDETHYIDGPGFGALVRVWQPAEATAPAP